MADLLTTLPPEVFSLIIEQLPKADLKQLVQGSRWLRENVANRLWQSITIKPLDEHSLHRIRVADLPQSCLQRATQLHFRSSFQFATTGRCPHEDEFNFFANTDDDDDDDDYHEDEDDANDEVNDAFPNRPFFDHLARKTESLLRRIESHQLRSFSWDLGTCVPSEILGADGVLPRQQPSIRSLSLITDPTCSHYDSAGEIDLSSFLQLRSLRWAGPNADSLDALAVALRNNSTQLRRLQLDLVNWAELQGNLAYFLDDNSDSDSDIDDTKEADYFAHAVLGLNNSSPSPLFPAIRVLSLSQVPLSEAMATIFNFDTLVSLTLRMCPGWDRLIRCFIQPSCSIRLKMLEIHDSQDVTDEGSDLAILDFLDAFEGLEELFIGQLGPVSALELWSHLARGHATLKKLVCHQRAINGNVVSANFEREYDVPDLALPGRDVRRIKEDPSQNPLAKLDLEFLGLTCVPERLKYILLPFVSKASLKVLHIRQSSLDLKCYASWAMNDDACRGTPGARSDTSSERDSFPWTDSGFTTPAGMMEDAAPGPHMNAEIASSRENGTEGGPKLRNEFRHFAEWVFGPQGIASLDILAFGDFSHGGRASTYNLLLCRNAEERSGFQLLSMHGREWQEVEDRYGTALEACPMEPLFGGPIEIVNTLL